MNDIESLDVYNHSACEMEKGATAMCPRCKGHGSIFGDGEACFLCDGRGEVIISINGWVRSLDDPPMVSQLY